MLELLQCFRDLGAIGSGVRDARCGLLASETNDDEAGKRDLIEDTLRAIEKYVPDIRGRLDYVEAATPMTFEQSRLSTASLKSSRGVRRALATSRT